MLRVCNIFYGKSKIVGSLGPYYGNIITNLGAKDNLIGLPQPLILCEIHLFPMGLTQYW